MHGSPSGSEAAVETLVLPWRSGTTGARDESSLIRQARAGSADAVESLVRRHWDGAHRAAYLIVHDAAAAEDIAQEAMLAAVRAIDSFDRRRPFRPWLHRIVVNRSLDWLRARSRRPEVSSELTGVLEGEAGETDRLSDDLMAALAELEPADRALVVLRHLLGYRASELGRMLDMPAATVRTRLARALARLRVLLESEEEQG
jgi:RNA polymerase sigma-70 factor, ECF subfamily